MSGFDASAIKKKIQPVAKKKAQQMAKEFSEDMEREWLSIVDKFYDDYDPTFYVRHEDRGKNNNSKSWRIGIYNQFPGGERGLYKSYSVYSSYNVARENAMYGGIYVNSKHMYDDYGQPESIINGVDVRQSSQFVLECFWDGWHGYYWGRRGKTGYTPSKAAIDSYQKLYKKYLKRCSV